MSTLDAFKSLVEAAASIQSEAEAIGTARALMRAAMPILDPGDRKTLAEFTEDAFGL